MDGTGYGADEPRLRNTRPRDPFRVASYDNIESPWWRQQAGLSDVEWRVLERFRLSRITLVTAARRARAFHLPLISVLIANGALGDEDWWRALAAELGLAFQARVPPALIAPPFQSGRFTVPDPCVALIPGAEPSDTTRQALAPRGPSVDALRNLLERHPEIAARIVIAPPDAIERGVRAAASQAAARDAVDGLATRAPHLSAKGAPSWTQVMVVSVAFMLGLLAFLMFPVAFLVLMCVPISFAFLAISSFRVQAGMVPDRHPPALLRYGRAPRYLVLVPLYREAAVLADLVTSLSDLRYPRERLTVALVCEADDLETIAALGQLRLPAHFRIVEVPPSEPRTKPRALQYAVSLFACDLVTVYDAEDRPHPCQLIEAAQAFAHGPPRLACLQAPLMIDNVEGGSTWISRQFAVEYDALFRRVLPLMADLKLPIPLGGTSMHLKRSVLDEVGGWDPYNVTEDADLGLRLARFGYQTDCLALPTHEEAPIDATAWIKQRSRWLKGWMQTWLVHMRSPLALWREAGPAGFLTLNLFVIGSVVAAFAYPASLLFLVLGLTGFVPMFSDRTIWGDVWLVAFLLAFFSGIGASLWLVAVSAMRTRALALWEVSLTLVYWGLLLPAFLRAAWQLIVAPHYWQKTTHGLADRRAPPRHKERRRLRPRAPLRGPGSPR